MQPALFEIAEQVLFEDAEGGIRYRPGLIPSLQAAAWFDALQREVRWRTWQRPMYERVVEVPRLIASYGLDSPDVPPVLMAALDAVQAVVDAPFDTAGLNLYRDGRDSVAPHNDTLHALAPAQPIALLSLGDTRTMVITPKPGVRGRRIRLPLEPGSLLLMSHAAQHTHDHGIPKTREPVGPRISIAFRATRRDTDLMRGYIATS